MVSCEVHRYAISDLEVIPGTKLMLHTSTRVLRGQGVRHSRPGIEKNSLGLSLAHLVVIYNEE